MGYAGDNLDRVMTPEQFTQVVEAILAGKYSWACVLILRFAGYNPLHYIPYRTYNRLMKDHQPNSRWNASRNSANRDTGVKAEGLQSVVHPDVNPYPSDAKTRIQDLEYAESASSQMANLQGGMGSNIIHFPLLRSE